MTRTVGGGHDAAVIAGPIHPGCGEGAERLPVVAAAGEAAPIAVSPAARTARSATPVVRVLLLMPVRPLCR